ncbi:adenylate kinase family protein [Natronocalculus amylovorans]|uniref:Putative adenylate kinase n=1 Tax=Natronocalculus amylovorans TaxID=2917812 RepID=A0AAE3FX79_9EURY|nr:adenylate kinase family protein [Natronocalculus amylovorans]MCL9817042.1 adenylate kinase family protein [Natronocalculus amylovorans]
MRVAVTGTPGTGKTTAVTAADSLSVPIVHLNETITTHELWTERDTDRDSLIADLDAVRSHLGAWEGIVESHLSHYLDADRVIVLRCEPATLESRLLDRGETPKKARENAESEALDVLLSEAVSQHGAEKVYEIDTTGKKPKEVATEIEAVVTGTKEPSAGTVDFTQYLTQ